MPKIIVYTKVPCPYCINAKNLLKELGHTFEEIDLTNNFEKMDEIKNETGWRTFPIILIDDQLIGGYTDLKAYVEQGKL